MTYILLWNAKDYIFMKVSISLDPIDFQCIDKKTVESHSAFVQNEGE